MYNGSKIEELISHKKIMKKDLIEAMGWSGNRQLYQIINGNPTAGNLEKIADFFNVPIDYFFDREGVVDTLKDTSKDMTLSFPSKGVDARLMQTMQALVVEKDQRILLLEKYISLLEQRQIGDTKE